MEENEWKKEEEKITRSMNSWNLFVKVALFASTFIYFVLFKKKLMGEWNEWKMKEILEKYFSLLIVSLEFPLWKYFEIQGNQGKLEVQKEGLFLKLHFLHDTWLYEAKKKKKLEPHWKEKKKITESSIFWSCSSTFSKKISWSFWVFFEAKIFSLSFPFSNSLRISPSLSRSWYPYL